MVSYDYFICNVLQTNNPVGNSLWKIQSVQYCICTQERISAEANRKKLLEIFAAIFGNFRINGSVS